MRIPNLGFGGESPSQTGRSGQNYWVFQRCSSKFLKEKCPLMREVFEGEVMELRCISTNKVTKNILRNMKKEPIKLLTR
jgi:hypothetical protein